MTAETFRLGVEQALAVAILRKAERLAELHSDLSRLTVYCPYSAPELLQLEQNGLRYDAQTGLFSEVQHG